MKNLGKDTGRRFWNGGLKADILIPDMHQHLQKIAIAINILNQMSFETKFIPDYEEEDRRQRFANMTDQYPKMAQLMTGKTWEEIYALTAPLIPRRD